MYARVIVDISHAKVDKLFEYSVPEGMKLQIGSRVRVPFANKIIDGYVLELSDACDFDQSRIKQVSCVLEPFAALGWDQIELARYLKTKYNTTLAVALRLMLPAQVRHHAAHEKTQKIVFVRTERLGEAKERLIAKNGNIKYPRQMEILEELEKKGPLPAAVLNASALRSLLKKEVVYIRTKKIKRLAFEGAVEPEEDVSLTQQQRAVLKEMLGHEGGRFLLHGVTGSGKTEVYIRMIRKCLQQGKTAILLVPEISLTPQTYNFLKRRFAQPIAVFHSGLSAGERLDEWLMVKRGEANIVLGARSAVFAPVDNLGVMIIDEEHENSYQADNYPNYTALEIAEKRCALTGATLILGSATPSIETYYAAQNGKYTLLKMPDRLFSLGLPHVQIVDMREELKRGNTGIISGVLYSELEKTLVQGKQAMLFLNRRGYSTFVMCHACGYTVRCDACDVTMTYHKNPEILKCHYCGRTKKIAQVCPECGKPYLKYFGMGTQQVQEEVNALFPKARVMRMDLDTMTAKDAHQKVYKDFFENKADILIGTQMITKGFDFENVRLSAVIAAETMLNIPDYRSAERSFMLMTQVAGRSGRKQQGEVVLQTYHPLNYVIRYVKNHDYEGFYEEEIALRKMAQLPPFTVMIQFIFSGKNEERTILCVRDFLRKINTVMGADKSDIISIKAGEAPIRRINQMARYMIYLIIKKGTGRGLTKIMELFQNTVYEDVLVGIEMNHMNL